jgi:hypothetical protein
MYDEPPVRAAHARSARRWIAVSIRRTVLATQ